MWLNVVKRGFYVVKSGFMWLKSINGGFMWLKVVV